MLKESSTMNEFKSRQITVGEYLRARDLMVEERGDVWTIHEIYEFKDDKLAELIEAYDLVIDSLTCLAIGAAKKNEK